MDIVYGDITTVVLERGGSVVHQGNLMKVAGAGVALAIRNAWPRWFIHYSHKTARLGEVDAFPVQAEPAISIITLYAQQGIGTDKRRTDYPAFLTAIEEVSELSKMRVIPSPLYLPYKIGCGLGGGDWNRILFIIQNHLPQAILVDNRVQSHKKVA